MAHCHLQLQGWRGAAITGGSCARVQPPPVLWRLADVLMLSGLGAASWFFKLAHPLPTALPQVQLARRRLSLSPCPSWRIDAAPAAAAEAPSPYTPLATPGRRSYAQALK